MALTRLSPGVSNGSISWQDRGKIQAFKEYSFPPFKQSDIIGVWSNEDGRKMSH